MRRWTLVAVFLSAASLALGTTLRDPIRNSLPPPAPPKDSSFEDVLFWDDFSGDLEAWTPDREGVWSVRGGMLRADLPDRKNLHSFLYAGKEDWADYALEFHVLAMRGVDKGAAVRVEGDQGIAVDLRGLGYHDVVIHRKAWRIGQADVINANGMWHHVRIEARGSRYRVWVNGATVLDRSGGHGRANGRIALAAYTGGVGECTIYFDNVLVHKLGALPDSSEISVAEGEKTE